MEQIALPFDVPVSLVEAEFDEWIQTSDGKAVEHSVAHRALTLHERGWSHYSIDGLFHAARYDRSLSVGPDKGFRLNNNHRSFMARRIMRLSPELEGFFELRVLRGRTWRKSDKTRADLV